jgi:hypothetical protein
MPEPSHPTRFIFKEVALGDVKKAQKISATVNTGRGARDLRFGDVQRVGPFIEKVLREASAQKVDYKESENLKTDFWWRDGTNILSHPAYFIPPKIGGSRKEWRLARINNCESIRLNRISDLLNSNFRAVLLIIQHGDGKLWPRVISSQSLEKPNWDLRAKSLLKDALEANAINRRLALGYIDFVSGESYHNG